MNNQPRTFVLTVNRRIGRFDATAQHLNEIGVRWERFDGMDNQLCRLNSIDTFDLDRAGEHLSPKHIAATLSHYMLWKVMSYLPEEVFWVLEYDARFVPGWEEQYQRAMSALPDDWDIVFLGSCCCKGKPSRQIRASNLYEIVYPMCGHAIMYRKKSFSVLLQEHQKIAAPLDIAMIQMSLPKLRVYTILPAIVEQRDTYAPQ